MTVLPLINYLTSPLSIKITHREMTSKDPTIFKTLNALMACINKKEEQNLYQNLETPFNDKINRNFNNPIFFEDDYIKSESWSDNPKKPLKKSEKWNIDNRKTFSGIAYELDENGLPLMPYYNSGIKGRGKIGRYGPNHAVDMGILKIKENAHGQKTLHCLGIIRSDDQRPALCGGFIEFSKNEHTLDLKKIINTQTNEFIEEMLTGSILPDLTPDKKASLQEKNEQTHKKMSLIRKNDPAIFQALQDEFLYAHKCYAGPVLNSSRNTNNAWMETYLSWFEMTDEKWDNIKKNCYYDYNFVAGDDASSVMWHEITPELVEKATPSHGSYFTFLFTDYLVSQQEISHDLKEQANRLLFSLQKHQVKYMPQNKI